MRYLILLLSSLAIYAQDVQEQIQVILRETRVHVVDKDGRPVRGLTLEDFVLEENGKGQVLTHFDEVDYDRMTVKPGQIIQKLSRPQRTSILVLETSDLATGDFNALIEGMRDFIEHDLGSDDFMKLVQLDEKATSLTSFTNDKNVLLAGLAKAIPNGRLKKSLMAAETGIVNEIPEFMRLDEEVNKWQAIADTASGRARETALVNVARYESQRDNRARTIDRMVEEKEDIKARSYRGHYLQMQYIARMMAPMDGTKSIYLLSGGLYLEHDPISSNTKEMAERLGRLLNTHKITVYSIQQSTRILPGEGQLQMSTVPVNVSLLQNMPSLDQGFSRNAKSLRNPDNTVIENNRQSETGVRAAAETTGGVFKRGLRMNLAKMLREVREASGHFYVLGYTVEGSEAEVKSQLKIRLSSQSGNYRLHYGSEYAENIPYRKLLPDEQAVSFKADLLYAKTSRDDLLAEWDYYLFSDENGGYRIPVTGNFPLDSDSAYDIGFTALGENREPLDYVYTSLKTMPSGEEVSFYDVLFTEKRPHYIRFSARSLASDEYSIEEFVLAAPRVSESETHLSDLVPIYDPRKTLPLSELRDRERSRSTLKTGKSRKEKKQEEGTETAEGKRLRRDPFRYEDQSVRPNGITRFNAPESVDIFFHMQNFTDPEPDLKLQFMLKTRKNIFPPRATSLVNVARLDEDTLLYHCRLDTRGLPPDLYEVWVKMVDSKQDKEYKSYHRMEIVNEEL